MSIQKAIDEVYPEPDQRDDEMTEVYSFLASV